MNGLDFFRRPWIRAGLILTAAAVTISGMAIAGHGYPEQAVRLLSGSAWLESSNVGQATLLDGTSAEVAAQVPIGPAGHALAVVQQGSTAYAVDRTDGTVRRVDGATFDLTPPIAPIDQARDGLAAFAGTTTLYTLDTQRGLLASSDPRTLVPRGRPLPLAARVSAGTATLDDADRLWLVDDATGDLTWIADGIRTTRRQFTQPGHNLLTVADGGPVVVNVGDRTATSIDPNTGDTRAAIPLDLRPDDTIQVSGSPHSKRLYVVASRGVLDICDLGASTCDNVVPLDAAGRELGAAVEAGNRLFVPDYTTGQVFIVDLARSSVIAKSSVLTPPGRFQLLTRDGIVFFNDPATERAGVIRLDGSVKDIAKYDPKDPNKGLHVDTGNTSAPPTSSQNPPTTPQQPPTTETPPPPTGNPNRPTDGQTAVPTPGQPTSPPTSGPGTTLPPVPPILRITQSKLNPQVNEDITLRVDNAAGDAPAAAQWDFGDNGKGSGVTVTHHWTTEKTFQVSVQTSMPDGQQATTSVTIQVTPPPSVTVPAVVGMTDAAARAAISAASLVPVTSQAPSNTVAKGVVISQTPPGGTSAAPRTQVDITVSSGKPAPVDLMARAAGASWTTGAGALPFNGSDGDSRGFAVARHGLTEGGCALEDGSAPDPYLETHPEWVNNGFINGVYTLPSPLIAGDHFRSKIGFIWCNPNEAGDATFVVSVIFPNGTTVEVARVHDISADRVMHQIDADLTAQAGATKIQLRVEAGASSAQDWASWIHPQIGS